MLQPAFGDEAEPVVGCEHEEARLLVLGGADDGHGLRHHELVRQVVVQVHRTEKGRLAGMSVDL